MTQPTVHVSRDFDDGDLSHYSCSAADQTQDSGEFSFTASRSLYDQPDEVLLDVLAEHNEVAAEVIRDARAAGTVPSVTRHSIDDEIAKLRNAYQKYREEWSRWGSKEFVLAIVAKFRVPHAEAKEMFAAHPAHTVAFFERLNPCGDFHSDSGNPIFHRSVERCTRAAMEEWQRELKRERSLDKSAFDAVMSGVHAQLPPEMQAKALERAGRFAEALPETDVGRRAVEAAIERKDAKPAATTTPAPAAAPGRRL